MVTDLPKYDLDFDASLTKTGLTLERNEKAEANGCYRLIQYASSEIAVRLTLERTRWSVELADMAARPDCWYSVIFLRELLRERPSDDMPLADQLEFLKSNWAAIVGRFASPNRDQTHARLASLRMERARRVYPSWPDAVLELESFLTKEGLVCQRREAPHGALGDRFMQLVNKDVGVRVDISQGRCSVEIADLNSRPSTWYDLDLLQHLLQWPAKWKLSYSERFEFLKANWHEIVRRLSTSEQQDTHTRLDQLKIET